MQHFTDDLYPLEPIYATEPFGYPQQQLQPQWAAPTDYSPVQQHQQHQQQRHVARYQPYPTSSPRVSHYAHGHGHVQSQSQSWDVNVVDYALLDYSSMAYGGFGAAPIAANAGLAPALCAESHSSLSSHGLYQPYGIAPAYSSTYGLYQHQQQPHAQPPQPTCIAPEDLFARLPLTPISPASLEDSDDRASSPSSAATSSSPETPLSARSSPNRPGLQIPTVPSLTLSITSVAPSWTSNNSSNSSLPSPVDSLSSHSSQDEEAAFVPTPSLKKSAAATSSLKSKRATRSAAPEPAWVEAVLAEDAKRLQQDPASANSNASRPANRPIAFACVFCRHRKIQCIRPKTETAPGEKPAPCNQCEKRNRCCEYPPAALNPRIGRRTRPAGSIRNED